MTGNDSDELLFHEKGGSTLWLAVGPAMALGMLILQRTAGNGFQPMVPLVILVVVTGFLALQLKAARIHTSVELTRETLREGTEVTSVNQIVEVFDPPEFSLRADLKTDLKPDRSQEQWQDARVLGELHNVPRGRTAIGIKLTGDRIAQAWARDDRRLRALLVELIEARDA